MMDSRLSFAPITALMRNVSPIVSRMRAAVSAPIEARASSGRRSTAWLVASIGEIPAMRWAPR